MIDIQEVVVDNGALQYEREKNLIQQSGKIDLNKLPDLDSQIEWFFEDFQVNGKDSYKQYEFTDFLYDYAEILSKQFGTWVKSGEKVFVDLKSCNSGVLWELLAYAVEITNLTKPLKIIRYVNTIDALNKPGLKRMLILISRIEGEDISLFRLPRAIIETVERSASDIEITIYEPESIAELENVLKTTEYDLIHFDVHGVRAKDDNDSWQCYLRFGSNHQSVFYVSPTQLREVLTEPTFCVFNSCWSDFGNFKSRGFAETLARSGCDVISFKWPISVNDAEAFFVDFYCSFFETGDLWLSFNKGRLKLRSKGFATNAHKRATNHNFINVSLYSKHQHFEIDKGQHDIQRPHNERAQSIFDRDFDMESLNSLTQTSKLICLHGAFGVGKTTLLSDQYNYWKHQLDRKLVIMVNSLFDLELKLRSDQPCILIADVNLKSTDDFVPYERLIQEFLDRHEGNRIVFTSYAKLALNINYCIEYYELCSLDKKQFRAYLKRKFPAAFEYVNSQYRKVFETRLFQVSSGIPLFIDMICRSDFRAYLKEFNQLKWGYQIKFDDLSEPLIFGEIERIWEQLEENEKDGLLKIACFESDIPMRSDVPIGQQLSVADETFQRIIQRKDFEKFISYKHYTQVGNTSFLVVSPFLKLFLQTKARTNIRSEEKSQQGYMDYYLGKKGVFGDEQNQERLMWFFTVSKKRPSEIVADLLKILKYSAELVPNVALIDSVEEVVLESREFEMFTRVYRHLRKSMYSQGLYPHPNQEIHVVRAKMAKLAAKAYLMQNDSHPWKADDAARGELNCQRILDVSLFRNELLSFTYVSKSLNGGTEDSVRYESQWLFKSWAVGNDLYEISRSFSYNDFLITLEGCESVRQKIDVLIDLIKLALLKDDKEGAKEYLEELRPLILESDDNLTYETGTSEILSCVAGLGRIPVDSLLKKCSALTNKFNRDGRHSLEYRTDLLIAIIWREEKTPLTLTDVLISNYWRYASNWGNSLESGIGAFLISYNLVQHKSYYKAYRNYRKMLRQALRLSNFNYHAIFIIAHAFTKKGKKIYALLVFFHGLKILLGTNCRQKSKARLYFKEMLRRKFTLKANGQKELNKIESFMLENNIIQNPYELAIKSLVLLPN